MSTLAHRQYLSMLLIVNGSLGWPPTVSAQGIHNMMAYELEYVPVKDWKLLDPDTAQPHDWTLERIKFAVNYERELKAKVDGYTRNNCVSKGTEPMRLSKEQYDFIRSIAKLTQDSVLVTDETVAAVKRYELTELEPDEWKTVNQYRMTVEEARLMADAESKRKNEKELRRTHSVDPDKLAPVQVDGKTVLKKPDVTIWLTYGDNGRVNIQVDPPDSTIIKRPKG